MQEAGQRRDVPISLGPLAAQALPPPPPAAICPPLPPLPPPTCISVASVMEPATRLPIYI